MILTVTTNAALDRVLFIERFIHGIPMRASKCVDCVGGKGFDVSVALRGLDVDTVGLGIVAGRRGMDLVNFMKAYGIQLDLAWGEGETRLAHVIIETELHDHSHIITSASPVSAKLRENLLRMYRLRLATTGYVVIAGSLAPGLPEDFYKTLVSLARELDATSEGKLPDALRRLRVFDLGRFEHLQFSQCRNCSPCEDLATLLDELDAAAGELSDWLAMRYFTHVSDVSRQTMAL